MQLNSTHHRINRILVLARDTIWEQLLKGKWLSIYRGCKILLTLDDLKRFPPAYLFKNFKNNRGIDTKRYCKFSTRESLIFIWLKVFNIFLFLYWILIFSRRLLLLLRLMPCLFKETKLYIIYIRNIIIFYYPIAMSFIQLSVCMLLLYLVYELLLIIYRVINWLDKWIKKIDRILNTLCIRSSGRLVCHLKDTISN